MSGIVVGAIAPHGGIAVAELCDESELDVAAATRAGLEELGRRFAAAAPETIVVLTPHNVHIDGLAGGDRRRQRSRASVDEDGREIALTSPVDVDLALALARRASRVPASRRRRSATAATGPPRRRCRWTGAR